MIQDVSKAGLVSSEAPFEEFVIYARGTWCRFIRSGRKSSSDFHRGNTVEVPCGKMQSFHGMKGAVRRCGKIEEAGMEDLRHFHQYGCGAGRTVDRREPGLSSALSPHGQVPNVSIRAFNEGLKPISFGVAYGESQCFASQAMVFSMKRGHTSCGVPAGNIPKG